MTRLLCLDIATSGIADAADYLDKASIEAPSNYVKPEAIAGYVEKEFARRLALAGVDLDLARITAIGLSDGGDVDVRLCRNEGEERAQLSDLAGALRDFDKTVTFNGLSFDLPLLMRRARYLGVQFPPLNLDRYKSPHIDLMQVLCDRDPQRRRSLEFYRRRLQLGPDKPMSGADEANVFETGDWDGLEASVRHDVATIRGLASWLGILPAVAPPRTAQETPR